MLHLYVNKESVDMEYVKLILGIRKKVASHRQNREKTWIQR